ncbi:hypothetical protein MMC20_003937 [Loxospora ochrophaea]|nr:hypothetical protein [Loxospora ochrophaea]
MAYGSVSSWPDIYHKIFSHLKPGYGYLEQVEIDVRPRCDDGTLPGDSIICKWYDWVRDATHRVSRSIDYMPNTKQMLQVQGFVDIEETVIQMPINSWHPHPHQKDIGRWYNLGLTEGLEAMSLGPLTRIYKWPPDDVRRLVGEVKTAICNRQFHVYNTM